MHRRDAWIGFWWGLLLVLLMLGSVVGIVAMLAGISNYSHGYDDESGFRSWFTLGAVVFGVSVPLLLSLMIRQVKSSRRQQREKE
jgi:formate-dependent nitrite reductase membrane component NrfD